MKNEVNFILQGTAREPILQQWQIGLRTFQHQQKPLLLPYVKQPVYLKFSKSMADKLALMTRPALLLILTLFTAITFLNLNIKSVWWWLCAVPVVLLELLLIYKVFAQIINERRVKIHIASIPTNISVFVYDGPPGAGKTSSMMSDLMFLADSMWAKIREEYSMLEPFLDEINFWPTKQKEDALEIIEAYEFFSTSGGYPCLWSTVPAFVDGVPVHVLSADHLLQKKRLPYGSVCILDETSLILPQELYKNKPYEIVEMCKLLRHFGDFHFGSTEQDEDSNVIYLRRVAGQSRHLIEQRWIDQPKVLQWIYNKLFSLRSRKPQTVRSVIFFKNFKRYIKAFGYRKYFYTDNTSSKVQSFVLKPNLYIDYDDRCYKNVYRCLDKPLEKSVWEYYRPSKRDLAKIFPEELRQSAKTKIQLKKEAIERRKANVKTKSRSVKTSPGN